VNLWGPIELSVEFLYPPFPVLTPRTLIGCSVLALALLTLFGVLNAQRTHGLRVRPMESGSSPPVERRVGVQGEQELQGSEALVIAANARLAEMQTKVASAKAELIKAQTEKGDLEAKVRGNETQIAQLQKRIDDVEKKATVSGSPGTPSIAELQARLEALRKQLDASELEKALLSDRIKTFQERPANEKTETKSRTPTGGHPGIRGTVLAVNSVYNFVVLDLGGRQGVEPDTEMLVLRGGSLIGKIRVSSVEPATTIGDIISTSLARGVQVQSGDTVIYAGTNF
jgi:hypothetical protein